MMLKSKEKVRTIPYVGTQKAITTLAQNKADEVIMIHRCSEPNEQVSRLYDSLKFKYAPENIVQMASIPMRFYEVASL